MALALGSHCWPCWVVTSMHILENGATQPHLAGATDVTKDENLVIPDNQEDFRVFYPGLPWWLRGEESACQCRRHGFDPWFRKILHTVEQLSLRATTTEPVLYTPGAATTEPTYSNY